MSTHACYNLPRHDSKASYTAQSGWNDTFYDGFGVPFKTQRYVEITTDFQPGCKYDLRGSDARCDGCVNRAAP